MTTTTLLTTAEHLFDQNKLGPALELANRAKALAAWRHQRYLWARAGLLQAKIHVCWGRYSAGLRLFSEAQPALFEAPPSLLAQLHLWWGYGLLLNMQPEAAFFQLQEALDLCLSLTHVDPALQRTLRATEPLLHYFLHQAHTRPGIEPGLTWLLDKSQTESLAGRDTGLQFFAFGVPALLVNGRRRHFKRNGGDKLPEMLAYLLLHAPTGGCFWDEVCDAVWPDLTADSAISRFHHMTRRLRNNFRGRPYLRQDQGVYQFDLSRPLWGDLLAFEHLLQRIANLPAQAALPLQLELISLYAGEFLAGFEVAPWARVYRAWCENRFLQTVEVAGQALLATHRPRKVLEIARKGVRHDYFAEAIHGLILQAYADLGLHHELIRHYTELCHQFKQELGHGPQPDLADLFERLVGER